jgi:integrase
VFRQSDGSLSSRRGYVSRRAAVAARRKLMESVDRHEVVVRREDFESFWEQFAADKRPYETAGSPLDLVTHGRKRLLPFFGADQLSSIDAERVREWLRVMVELVEAGEISPKTVNNARTSRSMAFEEVSRRGLIVRNPCSAVRALPVDRAEVEFLRLAEIDSYLDACSDTYRPLAEFLIGTGARISEAVAIRWADVDLEEGVARFYRQRERTSSGTRPTKGKRFRSVQMGPRLSETLRSLRLSRRSQEIADDGWVFLCPPPSRGRYASRTQPVPPHRRTVHEWHEAALHDAGLRDMPLHSLRHTAAASWLAVGHPLIFVMRQLGHRAITTTEEYYGHLEGSFVKGAAVMTEAAIIDARPIARPTGTGERERYSARRSD